MKTIPLLLASFVIALTAALYLHNGRCFACDTEPADECTRHNGPCSVQNASIVYDRGECPFGMLCE